MKYKLDRQTDRLLPTETLGYFSKAIDRKQKGRVAIATQATQEVTRGTEALLCGCVLCYHGNGVKQEVLQVVTKLLVTEELQIWPTIVGWREAMMVLMSGRSL